MATVVLDTTRVNDAEAVTGWTKITGGKAPTVNPDYFYQNANSISVKATNAAIDGPAYTHASTIDFSTTPRMWIAKILSATPGLIDTALANGFQVWIGDSGNYNTYYLYGPTTYPATKSWVIIAVDPNQLAFVDAAVGNIDLTAIDYFVLGQKLGAGLSTLGENVAQDAIDWVQIGQGSLLTGTGGDFEDFRADDEDDLINGRAGVIYSIDDELFSVAMLRIGDANEVGFDDANKSIVWVAGIIGEGAIGLAVNVTHASSDVNINATRFKTQKSIYSTTKFFDTALEVDGGLEEITLLGHDYQTGDYVLYSDEGGTAITGLTDNTNYWVYVVDSDTIALHASRASALADTTRVGITADAAPGENHSFTREPDNRADITITGTGGEYDTTDCTYDTIREITLTSAATLTGGFIIFIGKIIASTGGLDGVTIIDPTTTEGEPLFPSLSTINNIAGCSINAGDEGHAFEITSGGAQTSNNTYSDFWSPADDGWNFHTQTGIDPSGEVITTDAAHGFTTGDAVYYNDEGGSDTVGLTDETKYYVNVLTTTTLSIHATRAAAVADSSRLNLSDGSSGETHSLYSGKATIYNNSGTSATISFTTGSTKPSVRNGTGASATVTGSVDMTITVLDKVTLLPIENVQTSIRLADSPYTELMNEDTTALGVATEAYGGSTPVDIVWRARKSENTDDPRYFGESGVDEVTPTGFDLTILMEENPFI